jgi:hypothetical protein
MGMNPPSRVSATPTGRTDPNSTNNWRNGMPAFSSRELRILIAAASKERILLRKGAEVLLDKCCIRPTGELTLLGEPFYELTEYGRQVVGFYDCIKTGLVKTRKEQCSGCKTPCKNPGRYK